MGPALPGVECADVEPVFADGGHHRVEEVDGVAVAELVVRVALVGDCPGVAFDGGAGSSTGALEVVLGAFELLLGGVDLAAQVAALPARGGVESMLCGCHDAGVLRLLGSRRGVGRLDRRRLLRPLPQERSPRSLPQRLPELAALTAAPRGFRRRAGRVGLRRGRLGTSQGSRSAASASVRPERPVAVSTGRGHGVGWWRGCRHGRRRGWRRARRGPRRCRRCR